MKPTTIRLLEEIYQRLNIKKKVTDNLCESLNHRELFYVHLEICIYAKSYMPYEYVRSLESIDRWISEFVKDNYVLTHKNDTY